MSVVVPGSVAARTLGAPARGEYSPKALRASSSTNGASAGRYSRRLAVVVSIEVLFWNRIRPLGPPVPQETGATGRGVASATLRRVKGWNFEANDEYERHRPWRRTCC